MIDSQISEKKSNHAVFSVYIEYLFYSLPLQPLLSSVQSFIEVTREITFRNATLISKEDFLKRLKSYVKSMLIGWKDGMYLQMSGIRIGSCVAPIFSVIFLSQADRAIQVFLHLLPVQKVFGYLDFFDCV